MEAVRQELYLEEQEEKERQREAAAEAKRLRDMEEMQRVHKEQLYFKQLREEAEQRELEEFRQQVSAQRAALLQAAARGGRAARTGGVQTAGE